MRILVGCLAIILTWAGAGSAQDNKDYRIETVASGLDHPWSIDFLPNGDMLVTERSGTLRIIRDGVLAPDPIANVPEVFHRGQGGLFDVVLHPEFSENNYIYLTYAHGSLKKNATRIARGVWEGDALKDVEVIFTVEPWKATPAHYGGRLAFLHDGTMALTTGDGFNYREKAQDLTSLLGKTIRLNDDGSVPSDNPFVGRSDARDEIYTYGHRSPQGLAVDHSTGALYQNEHGPKGGDELNLLEAGKNYGWPIATYGVDYTGARISPYTEYPGTVQPLVDWTPSLAPSGLTIYNGDAFPHWKGDAFTGALKFKYVVRTDLEDGEVVGEEILFKDEINERIRDVRTGPDGFLYILTDEASGNVLRIVPTD